MINKQQLEKAHTQLVDKYSKYLETETKLVEHSNGFFDKRYLDEMMKAKSEWQLASNEFYGLLSFSTKGQEEIIERCRREISEANKDLERIAKEAEKNYNLSADEHKEIARKTENAMKKKTLAEQEITNQGGTVK